MLHTLQGSELGQWRTLWLIQHPPEPNCSLLVRAYTFYISSDVECEAAQRTGTVLSAANLAISSSCIFASWLEAKQHNALYGRSQLTTFSSERPLYTVHNSNKGPLISVDSHG
eukprot:750073-Amphidinium_carterae.1